MEQFKRTIMLLGEDKFEKLNKSHILVVGVGGVGGYVAEFLVRTGVGNITIVDQDVVDITNLNRQIIATNSTLNMPKVEALKARLLDINKNLKINCIYERVSDENVQEILKLDHFDYVIDAIDSTKDKISLISNSKRLNLPIISALGAGNRTGLPNYEVKDIYKTSDDGLARVIRKALRENEIASLDVAISTIKPVKPVQENDAGQRNIGSLVYFPASCAAVISSYVVEKLTN